MVKKTGRRRLNIVALLLAVAKVSVGGRPHNLNNSQNFDTDNNSALTKALLQSARPYRPKNNAINNNINIDTTTQHKQHQPKHRKLDGNLEITSSHTLKFSQCIDLQLLDKDLFDENVIDYTKNGQIMSTKSFALFHVCDNVSLCVLYVVWGLLCVLFTTCVFFVSFIFVSVCCLFTTVKHTILILLYSLISIYIVIPTTTSCRVIIMETTVPIMNQKMIYIWLI